MTSYEEQAWAQFAAEIAAEFVRGREFRLGPLRWKTGAAKVVAKVGQWTITLAVREHHSESRTWAETLIGAPYLHKSDFRFTICSGGPLSGPEKALGMQDIEIGYPEFDRDFIIKANEELTVRELVHSSRIRYLLQMHPGTALRILETWEAHSDGFKGAELIAGVYGPYDPHRVLLAKVNGIVTDVEHLRSLHDLIAETLNQLCEIGVASQEDPGVDP